MSNIGQVLAASVIMEHLEKRRDRVDRDPDRLDGGRVGRRYRRAPKRAPNRDR